MKTLLGGRASTLIIAFLRNRKVALRNKVLLPVNVCAVVRQSVLTAGCVPVYCDIHPENLCLDLAQTEALLKADSGIGTLLFNHTYGTCFWPEAELAHLKQHYNIALIDDCAAMFPELTPPRATCADITIYSTGYAKCVTLPYGGGFAFLPDDSDLSELPEHPLDEAARAYLKAHPDVSAEWLQTHHWYPTHLARPLEHYFDDIARTATQSLAHKQALNAIYDTPLHALRAPGDIHLWRYTLRLPPPVRENVRKAIFGAGLFVSAHYQPLAPGFPVAQELADTVLNLFNDAYFTEAQAKLCAKIILETIK